jgi:C4-dicarboxylate-specific signal transduction histidine kinase
MTTGAIIALCVSILLLGLSGVFFIVWFFFRKSKEEDGAVRQWQQGMMLRIDEALPSLERLLNEGIRVPAPVAESEAAAETYARHQDDDDAAMQRELEESNHIGEAERAVAAAVPFSDGGFVR